MSTMHKLLGLIASLCFLFEGSVGEVQVSCERTAFGCCDDGKTAAKGSNKEECPGILHNIFSIT